MSETAIEALDRRLIQDVDAHRWDSVLLGIEAATTLAVENIRDHQLAQLREIGKVLRSKYDALYRQDPGIRAEIDRKVVSERILGVNTAIALALRLSADTRPEEMIGQDKYRQLLDALARNPAGLSGRELAEATTPKRTEETVARNLPALRACGLVQSLSAGRGQVNRLTALAKDLLAVDRRPAEIIITELQEALAKKKRELEKAIADRDRKIKELSDDSARLPKSHGLKPVIFHVQDAKGNRVEVPATINYLKNTAVKTVMRDLLAKNRHLELRASPEKQAHEKDLISPPNRKQPYRLRQGGRS